MPRRNRRGGPPLFLGTKRLKAIRRELNYWARYHGLPEYHQEEE